MNIIAAKRPVAVNCRMDMSVPDFPSLLEQARAAEECGYNILFVRDHVSLAEHVVSNLNLEMWTSMTALACNTSRIGIGSQVVSVGWRNPALLAKMAATLDVFSNGRLILGLGVGALQREWEEYGWTFPPAFDRVKAMTEAIEIMKLMWTEEAPSFEGKYHRIKAAVNEPKPIQAGGPPIIIGARGKLSMRNVARYAQGWNAATGDLALFVEQRDLLYRYCEEIGRDPSEIDIHMNIRAIYDPNPASAERRRTALMEMMPVLLARNLPVAGAAEQMLEWMQPWVQAGVRNFTTFFLEPGRHVENITAFGQEVIPRLGQLG